MAVLLQGYAGGDWITNAELLELPVQILVPAATENVVTRKNADRIKAQLIVEGAKYWHLPQEYIEGLERIEVAP